MTGKAGKTIDAVQVIESVAQSTLASTRTTLRLDASWQVLRLLRQFLAVAMAEEL